MRKKEEKNTVCESVVAVEGERMCISDDLIIQYEWIKEVN